MSSSTTMVTVHSRESGSSGASGGGCMFGPRKISMPCASSGGAGARIWRSSTAVFTGVSDGAPQSGRDRRGWTRQVHLVGHGPRASREVTVEGSDADRIGRWRLSHPDARATHRLEHPCTRAHQVGVDAGTGYGVEDLTASRRHGHDETGIDRLVPQYRSGDGQVLEAGVDRAADADLRSPGARHLAHRDDVAW